MAIKSTPHSSRLQEWSLTIKCFSIIPRTLALGGESYSTIEMQSAYSIDPADWANTKRHLYTKKKKKNPLLSAKYRSYIIAMNFIVWIHYSILYLYLLKWNMCASQVTFFLSIQKKKTEMTQRNWLTPKRKNIFPKVNFS